MTAGEKHALTDVMGGDETGTEGETDGEERGVGAFPLRCHSGVTQPLIGREGWRLCMCSDGLGFNRTFVFTK